MNSFMKAFVAVHTTLFRLTGGKIGSKMMGLPNNPSGPAPSFGGSCANKIKAYTVSAHWV